MKAENRKSLSVRQRFEVFKRDGFVCQYCGSHPPEAILHADHIVAVANGGKNEPDNLITACDRCNFGKSNIPLSRIPESLDARMEVIREKELQIKGYTKLLCARRERLEKDVWAVYDAMFPGVTKMEAKDFVSVKMFVSRLGVEHSIVAAEKAFLRIPHEPRGRFKYFCAVCWAWIKKGVPNG